MRFGTLDTGILVVYLAIVAYIGFRVSRKEKNTTCDYLLAGSQLPGLPLVLCRDIFIG